MTDLTPYQRRIVDEYIDYWRDTSNCPREAAQNVRTDYELLASGIDSALTKFTETASDLSKRGTFHDELREELENIRNALSDLREHMAALDAVPSGKDLADEARHERERAADYRRAAV